MFVTITVDPRMVEFDVIEFNVTVDANSELIDVYDATIDEPVNVEKVMICAVTVETVAVETVKSVVEMVLLNCVETVAVE